MSMKEKVVLSTLLAVGVAGGVWWKQSGTPALSAPETMHNFGAVEPTGQVHHTFEIRNTGRQPLRINDIEVSCGCIKDARTPINIIPPGQKTELSMALELPPFRKDVRENITVKTNDPARPVQTFTVLAQVIPRIGLETAVVNYGIVNVADLPLTEEITIDKPSSSDAKDEVSFSAQGDYWQTKVEKPEPGKWRLSLTLLPNTPLGLIDGSVVVTPSWAKPRKLLVLGQVLGNVTAEPEEIYLKGSDAKSGKQEVRITVQKGKINSLKVVSIDSALKPFVQADSKESQVVVSYHFDGDKVPRSVKGFIKLETSTDEGVKILNLPLTFSAE